MLIRLVVPVGTRDRSMARTSLSCEIDVKADDDEDVTLGWKVVNVKTMPAFRTLFFLERSSSDNGLTFSFLKATRRRATATQKQDGAH